MYLQSRLEGIELNSFLATLQDPRASLATLQLAKDMLRKMAEDSWNESREKVRNSLVQQQVCVNCMRCCTSVGLKAIGRFVFKYLRRLFAAMKWRNHRRSRCWTTCRFSCSVWKRTFVTCQNQRKDIRVPGVTKWYDQQFHSLLGGVLNP